MISPRSFLVKSLRGGACLAAKLLHEVPKRLSRALSRALSLALALALSLVVSLALARARSLALALSLSLALSRALPRALWLALALALALALSRALSLSLSLALSLALALALGEPCLEGERPYRVLGEAVLLELGKLREGHHLELHPRHDPRPVELPVAFVALPNCAGCGLEFGVTGVPRCQDPPPP